MKNLEAKKGTIPFMKEWEQENVLPYWLDSEYCLIREVRYPLDYKHGNYTFRDFCGVVDEWNKVSYDHPLSAKGHQPKDLFFLIQKQQDLEAVQAILFLFLVMLSYNKRRSF
ncbi:hypothetical protein AAHH67_13870 [Niallia circulans]